MILNNDRPIKYSVAGNRKSMSYKGQSSLVSELWERLKTPARGAETLTEYLSLNKPKQDDLKDVGGFVGGTLNGPRRKAANITGRDLIALDLDNIPAGGTEDVLRRIEGLRCGYCVFSTRKHQPAAPRLRVLLPLLHTVTADEYEPIARKIAGYIGIEFADPTTYDCSRMMYWPSCCSDSEYVYLVGDKPFIDAGSVLATYADWHNTEEWPRAASEQTNFARLAKKQGDPEAKPGAIGAFCRVYDVPRAMDEIIPGIYEAVDTMPGRYTFTGGSTTGGAVLYDGGKFLYSHHATDPCSLKLVNAFDLVRLHKFGYMDEDADPATPVTRLPSYMEMVKFINALPEVAALIDTERYNEAVKDFEGVTADNSGEPANWMAKLSKTVTGNINKDPDNVIVALDNDAVLRDRIYNDTFYHKAFGRCPLPWGEHEKQKEGEVFKWEDADDNGLALYIKRLFGFWAPNIVSAGLTEYLAKNARNQVQEYLKSLKWDGLPRLDTLFIDYLGAEDNPYTRAVTRKAFTAAVARAMTPGCKYDNMLILSGPQGIGKSTILSVMAGSWFNDSIRTFEGKEASELLQGTWIVEVAELDAFRRTDVARIKQFLSVKEDNYRRAYGRNTSTFPRSCVFFGTTNSTEYLQDTTGNRRFWPVDVGVLPCNKSVFKQLPVERDQLWAEAVMRWRLGEPIFLSDDVTALAKAKQEDHMDINPLESSIQEFLSKELPIDWNTWAVDKRRIYWAGNVQEQGKIITVPRTRVCIVEIWEELLCKPRADLLKDRNQSRELAGIIRHLGWEAIGKRDTPPYGATKCYARKVAE